MPITCPCCRASNEDGPACRRCKADLSLLFAAEAYRERLLVSARAALAEGDRRQALHQVETADGIRRGPDSRQMLAVLALLDRDFAAAYSHQQTISG